MLLHPDETSCLTEGIGVGKHALVSPGGATARTALTFTSQASLAAGIGKQFQKAAVAVRNCRAIGKKDMIHNHATPRIEVDPETYEVRADGELLTCAPAEVLPLAQRYFLF